MLLLRLSTLSSFFFVVIVAAAFFLCSYFLFLFLFLLLLLIYAVLNRKTWMCPRQHNEKIRSKESKKFYTKSEKCCRTHFLNMSRIRFSKETCHLVPFYVEISKAKNNCIIKTNKKPRNNIRFFFVFFFYFS